MAALMALIPVDTRVWVQNSYDRHFVESIEIYMKILTKILRYSEYVQTRFFYCEPV